MIQRVMTLFFSETNYFCVLGLDYVQNVHRALGEMMGCWLSRVSSVLVPISSLSFVLVRIPPCKSSPFSVFEPMRPFQNSNNVSLISKTELSQVIYFSYRTWFFLYCHHLCSCFNFNAKPIQ